MTEKTPWEKHKDFWAARVDVVPIDPILKLLYKDPVLRLLVTWRTLGRYGLSPLVIAGLLGSSVPPST